LIEDSRMAASEYGFMIFSITGNEIKMQTIDYQGKILYATTIAR